VKDPNLRRRNGRSPQALPQRNLLRQLTWSLPSGQSIAGAMGVTPLADADLSELQPYSFQSSTPAEMEADADLCRVVVPDEGLPHLRGCRSHKQGGSSDAGDQLCRRVGGHYISRDTAV
jgi:hypothetical protein